MINFSKKNPFLAIIFLTILLTFALIAGLALPYFPSNPQVRAQGRLKYYGVDVANSGEFGWLKQQGVNLVMVALSPDRNTWASYFSAAEANGIKLIIWPLGGCQGSASVPWCWTGSGWDLSAGEDALRYAQEYVADGGTGLLAILSTHEPFWSAGLDDPANQVRSLYSAMKNVAPDVNVFAYIDDMAAYESQGYSITDGMCDWCGIWLHCFGGVEGSCDDAKQQIRDDRGLIDRKGLSMRLLFAVQTFGTDGYQMPSYQELKNFTCEIIAEDNIDIVIYYTWRNPAGYSDVLYTHPELYGVIREVYDECIQGLPPGPPTPTSTPSPTPNLPGDLDKDGDVDIFDYNLLVGNFGK